MCAARRSAPLVKRETRSRGLVGMLTMPYLLLYEGLGPLVAALAYVFVAVLAILGRTRPPRRAPRSGGSTPGGGS
jgi:hypothetical protein